MDWDTPYGQAVLTLARWHREGDQAAAAIYAFPDPQRQTVRLIEVSQIVPQTGEVYMVEFGPTAQMPFRTVVAQVTASEWEDICARRIELPDGWDLTGMVEVPEEVLA